MDIKKNPELCLGKGALLFVLLFALLTGTGCESKEERLSLETMDNAGTEYEALRDAGEQEGQIGEENALEEIPSVTENPEPSLIYVDVAGAVNNPGVYTFTSGDRVFQAIEAAGGFASDACTLGVNQARELADGEQLRILTIEETEQLRESGKGLDTGNNGTQVFQDAAAVQTEDSASDKVNLNTADQSTLMTLPGIGESKARAIISYREAQGGFQSAEEIMQVEGIKEGVFLKIKDKIVVG